MGGGIGTRIARREDDQLLRGQGRYVADLAERCLHAVFVRSTYAHARVGGVDTLPAVSMPGVVAVAVSGEMGLPLHAPLPGMIPDLRRPLLASEVVRHVGEPVAVVVAETLAQAIDAAEAVIIDLHPLPVAATPQDALSAGAPAVHESRPDNIYLTGRFPPTDSPDATRDVLVGAATIITSTTVSQRVAAVPMEPNGVLAVPGSPNGGVTLWASTQFVHGVQREVAHGLGLGVDEVRVVIPRVGGGFGPKFETPPEYVAVASLARTLGRAVRWQETRSESMVGMPHGRGHFQHASLGVRSDGTLSGLRVRVVTDAGAYPMAGAGSPVGTGVLMVPGPYRVRDLDIEVRTVATHTAPVGVYRGPGRAEPNYLRERLIDRAARQLGLDPVEIRRWNLLRSDELPYATPTGFTYDSGDYLACLDAAVDRVDLVGRRVEQQARRDAGDPCELGIGVSCWMDVTPRNRAGEYASLALSADDDRNLRVDVLAGTCDHGQGHEGSWALVIAEVLGIAHDTVRLVPADTDIVPRGDGTGSARSLQLVGSSLTVAAREVLAQARGIGAHLLEVGPADLVAGEDGLSVVGTPTRGVSWVDLVQAASNPGSLPAEVAALVPEGRLAAAADLDQDGPTFPFGVHVAVVEVDTETGAVELASLVAVDDCGRVVNPTVVEGQQHGGMAQGVAQALYEEIAFDGDGTPLTSNLLNYLVPSAADLPFFDVATVESPTPVNVLGAKGIGQGGAIGAPAAVVNAVLDALAPYGVTEIDMPLTPERVHRSIGAGRSAGEVPSDRVVADDSAVDEFDDPIEPHLFQQ